MKNKAQVTTFVVVGIVGLILVGLVIYFATSTTKRQSQKNVRITQQSTTRTQQVANFVTSCLEKTTKDGLILAGKQAGYIFTEQGGPQSKATIQSPFEQDGYYVAYAITVNKDKLIDLNKEKIVEEEIVVNPLSIQNQLEVYILNTIDDCADFSVLENQGFDIQQEGKNNEVKISENGVAVNLYYPIDVTHIKTKDKAHYENFNVNINVGLSSMYTIADSIVEGNSENPNQIAGLADYNVGLIEVTGEIINDPNDEDGAPNQLIRITDTNPDLQIKGQNHEFWFVKENWEEES